MKTRLSILATALLLATSLSLFAGDRPDEGKITSVDSNAKMMVVQGEHGDQWTLYWTETTQLKNGLTAGELRPGDSVHFDIVEKDGKMFLTELRRTHKADKD